MTWRNRCNRAPCLGAAICAIAAGCGPRNTYAPPPSPEVSIRHPERRDVTVYTAFPGRVEAVDTIELRARVRGYLRSIDLSGR